MYVTVHPVPKYGIIIEGKKKKKLFKKKNRWQGFFSHKIQTSVG